MESLAEDAETERASATESEYEDLLQQYDLLVNSAEATFAALTTDRIPSNDVDQLTHVLDDCHVCTHTALYLSIVNRSKLSTVNKVFDK